MNSGVVPLDGRAHLVEGALEQRQLIARGALLDHARGEITRGVVARRIHQRIDARQHQPPHRYLNQCQQQHDHQQDGTAAGQRDVALLANDVGRVHPPHNAQAPGGGMRHHHGCIGAAHAVGVVHQYGVTRLLASHGHERSLCNRGGLPGRHHGVDR